VSGTSEPFLLTIDVEDWFQVENLRPCYPVQSWFKQELRVEKNVQKILHLLAEEGVQATFFVLGWVAKRLPKLIREIADQGHEVASHGFGHVLCPDLSPTELVEDLKQSKTLLEDLIGEKVSGYRAPSFSVSEQLLDLLAETGYAYDSSYNSLGLNKRYGQLNLAQAQKHGLAYLFQNGVFELPLSNLSLGPITIPLAGGGYFRFWPYFLFQLGVKMVVARQPGYVFYIHPWEVDPGQPRVKEIGRLAGLRHYLNLDQTFSRLERLIADFSGECDFLTCSGYLALNTLKSA